MTKTARGARENGATSDWARATMRRCLDDALLASLTLSLDSPSAYLRACIETKLTDLSRNVTTNIPESMPHDFRRYRTGTNLLSCPPSYGHLLEMELGLRLSQLPRPSLRGLS